MPQGYDLLATTRITRILQTLAEELEIPGSLRLLDRTPVVPADESDIMGSYTANVVSADIVADDAAAVVRAGGKVALTTSAIPNIKQGSQITQGLLNLLKRINRGGGIPGDRGLFSQYIRHELESKLAAVRIMQNRMIAGMMIDTFSYQKGGIVYSGISWGMPADLKFTPTIAWTAANLATATPVTDLQAYVDYAQTNYNESYNRVSMSKSQFNIVVRTDNFRNNAKPYTQLASDPTIFPVNVTRTMAQLFEQITGLQIETYDATYKDENNDGTKTTSRYIPDNTAFLSNTADDNNSAAFDFGHTTVNETEVGIVPGTQVIGGGFAAPQFGPVSYATIKGDLNPPNLTLWAVERGFPRKHRASATARITMY